MSYDDEIDDLYRRSLGDFVGARNELAKRVKAEDKEAAAEIRTLSKPSVAAWVVNQLHWQDSAPFASLLDAGEAARVLQARAMRGEPTSGLAEALAARQRSLADLERLAELRLRAAGLATSTATMRQVSATLEALAAYGRAGEAPRAGRLTKELEPPGFGVLAGLGITAPPAPSETPRRRTQKSVEATPPPEQDEQLVEASPNVEDKREREAAQAALEGAREALALAREEQDAATLERETAKSKVEAVRAEEDAARAALLAARERLQQVEVALAEANAVFEDVDRRCAKHADAVQAAEVALGEAAERARNL